MAPLKPYKVLPTKPRHELKFVLQAGQKESLLNAIRFGLTCDTHGVDGTYRVTSLYYDTSDRQAFYEKLDGVLRRKKFRLRTYGPPQAKPGPSFMEIKHRYGNMICKERQLMPPEIAEQLFQHRVMPQDLTSCHPEFSASIAHQIQTNHPFYPLQPAVIVSYIRQAWMGLEEPDLRVTFDHKLSSHPPDDYLSPGEIEGQHFLGLDSLIMEVKFDHRLPRWLQQRLVSTGLRPVRYSKYLEAVLFQESPRRVAL